MGWVSRGRTMAQCPQTGVKNLLETLIQALLRPHGKWNLWWCLREQRLQQCWWEVVGAGCGIGGI